MESKHHPFHYNDHYNYDNAHCRQANSGGALACGTGEWSMGLDPCMMIPVMMIMMMTMMVMVMMVMMIVMMNWIDLNIVTNKT